MGHRLSHLAISVEALIIVNIHGSFISGLFDFLKDPLPPFQLRLDGGQGSTDGCSVQVGNGSRQVGKADPGCRVIEGSGQPSSLVVNENKGNLVRMVIHSHRQNIGDQKLRLAGSGAACHKTMGALIFFMQIQLELASVCGQSQRRCQRLARVIFRPPLQRIQVLHPPYSVELQEGEHPGQGKGPLLPPQSGIGQTSKADASLFPVIIIQLKADILPLLSLLQILQDMKAIRSQFDQGLGFLGHLAKEGNRGDAAMHLFPPNGLQHLHAVENSFAEGENKEKWMILQTFFQFLGLLQHLFQLPANPLPDQISPRRVRGNIAQTSILFPDMGQITNLRYLA